MKKVLIVFLLILISICGTACVQESTENTCEDKESATAVKTESPFENQQTEEIAQTETINVQPTEDSGEQAVSLMYADPEFDIYLVVKSGEWTYTKELYQGQVYFYPKSENPMASYTGFAVSSIKVGVNTIEQLWDNVRNNFEANISGFEWNQEDAVAVGEYSGYRYHFSSDEFIGDYFFWETESLLYTCSFTTYEEVYEEDLKMLLDSLETFQVLSEMQE